MSWLRNPKVKAALALLAIFLLGGGIGYVAGYWHAASSPWAGGWAGSWRAGGWGRGASRGGPPGEERYASRAEFFLRRLESDLKLTPAQSQRAGEILRRQHERLMEMRREFGPRLEGVLQEIRQELRSLMEPGQQTHFDQMVRDMEEHRRRWRERRWGHGTGPMMRGGPERP